jgi:hypothetical protein
MAGGSVYGDVMSEINDGRGDFDFFHGRWHVAGRKLVNNFDRECTEWIEFEGVAECRPILDGLGNVDTLTVESMPPMNIRYLGATLRLFHPGTGTWKIWWMSTRLPGVLDPPVEGRFDGDRGIFEGVDEYEGTPFVARYEWDVLGDGKAQWAQRFSWDDGATWDELNFIMTHTRLEP